MQTPPMPHAIGILVQRSRKRAIANGSRPDWQAPQRGIRTSICADGLAKSPQNEPNGTTPLSPRPLVAHAEQFHRPVGYRDPEGRADGAFDEIDLTAMGADQFGGDGEAQPTAAGPSRGLECLEQMFAGLCGN